MDKITIQPVQEMKGEVYIPGDKSLSHRSVMLSGLGNKTVTIKNFLPSQDCLSTVACMQSLGVTINIKSSTEVQVTGRGIYGLKEPENILDAGNSGTTLRLLTGILACQSFFCAFTGDSSLRRRPMGRVITPLSKMGCKIYGRADSKYLPIAILPTDEIQAIHYDMPVASAQVKSAILLAGLYANGSTTVNEPYTSRDHTERMLESFGVNVTRNGTSVTIHPATELKLPDTIEIAGDISSAAFWLVAASIIPNSNVLLKNVGTNPTRTGIIDVLLEMGANITIINQRLMGKEPVADISVKSSQLKGVTISAEIIPRLVDEIPILSVAALFAKGTTSITGAEELRVKETDRIRAIALEFGKMGAIITENADGLSIEGPQQLKSALCDSHDDHRMAMSLAVAGVASSGVEIENPDCVAISYPEFFATLRRLAPGSLLEDNK